MKTYVRIKKGSPRNPNVTLYGPFTTGAYKAALGTLSKTHSGASAEAMVSRMVQGYSDEEIDSLRACPADHGYRTFRVLPAHKIPRDPDWTDESLDFWHTEIFGL